LYIRSLPRAGCKGPGRPGDLLECPGDALRRIGSRAQSAASGKVSSLRLLHPDPREPYLNYPHDPSARCVLLFLAFSIYTGRPVNGLHVHLISLPPDGRALQLDLQPGNAVVRVLLFRSELLHIDAIILIIVQRKSCLFSFPSGPTEAILKSRSKRIPRSLLQGAAIEKCACFCCG
jgi:hypothetical protein